MDKWLPTSLICTIISSIASQLQLVPTSEFIDRSAALDYLGPLFPPCNSPENVESNGSAISVMVDFLLCEDRDIGALYHMLAILANTSGCQLKLRPCVRFPPQFVLPGPYSDACKSDLGFALVPEWQPIGKTMIKAPVHLSSPALVLGIEFEGSDGGLSPQDLTKLAHATQPHLEALVIARHNSSSSASALPACIFGIIYRNMTVFIVAHIAYLHQSMYRYRSLVVDKLPFLPYVSDDRKGLLARLRIIVALLTIQRHASLSAALWGDVFWPWAVVDYEENLVQKHIGSVSPRQSEADDKDADENRKIWGDSPPHNSASTSGFDEEDINPPPAELEHSKNLVDGWLSALDNMIESSMIPWEGSC
ncbi:hypothetical protein C8R43DRAFT_1053210 [Mycena crocata]|nr:hypothetical protein C8R43DRAFT_1053210 [Mycena crocata]